MIYTKAILISFVLIFLVASIDANFLTKHVLAWKKINKKVSTGEKIYNLTTKVGSDGLTYRSLRNFCNASFDQKKYRLSDYEQVDINVLEKYRLSAYKQKDINVLEKALNYFVELMPFKIVPKKLLDTYDLTQFIDKSFFEKSNGFAKLLKCGFLIDPNDEETSHFMMDLSFDMVQDHLHLYEGKPFEIFIRDTMDCTLRYNGPKTIVYDSNQHMYCPVKLSFSDFFENSLNIGNCNLKDTIELYQHLKISCNKEKRIDPLDLVKIVNSDSTFSYVYCPTLDLVNGNKTITCPIKDILVIHKSVDFKIKRESIIVNENLVDLDSYSMHVEDIVDDIIDRHENQHVSSDGMVMIIWRIILILVILFCTFYPFYLAFIYKDKISIKSIFSSKKLNPVKA